MRLCPFRVIGETALSQAQGKTGQGGILNKALSESIICLRFDSWGHNMLKFVVLESDLCELRDLSDSEYIPQLLNNYFSNVTLVFQVYRPNCSSLDSYFCPRNYSCIPKADSCVDSSLFSCPGNKSICVGTGHCLSTCQGPNKSFLAISSPVTDYVVVAGRLLSVLPWVTELKRLLRALRDSKKWRRDSGLSVTG